MSEVPLYCFRAHDTLNVGEAQMMRSGSASMVDVDGHPSAAHKVYCFRAHTTLNVGEAQMMRSGSASMVDTWMGTPVQPARKT